MTPNEQTAVEALKGLVDCISETRGKNANEALIKAKQAIALLEASPTVPVSRKDFEREADKLGFDLDNNMRGEYLDSHTAKTWKLVRALSQSNGVPQ